MESAKQTIASILEPYLEGTDKFLVDIKILPGNVVQVFIDSDTRITINDCAEISRFLGDRLDEGNAFSGRYTLEVSSAGMDEPLKKMRQYRKNIGRQVDVLLVTGIRKQGVLLYADDEKIQLEEVREKSIKKRQYNTTFLLLK